jgi:hypothetical protein
MFLKKVGTFFCTFGNVNNLYLCAKQIIFIYASTYNCANYDYYMVRNYK